MEFRQRISLSYAPHASRPNYYHILPPQNVCPGFLGAYLTFKARSEQLVPQLRADKTADWESTHREAQETMKRCSALRAQTVRDEREGAIGRKRARQRKGSYSSLCDMFMALFNATAMRQALLVTAALQMNDT